MSFSADCKQELCALSPLKPCCALAELGALYRSIGSLSFIGRGRVSVRFQSENLAVCRRAYTLLLKRLRIAPQVHYVDIRRFGGRRRGVLTLGPDEAVTFLKAMGMAEEGADGGWTLRFSSPRAPVTRQCCARAFLRGSLLGGGTLSSPDKGYRLELWYQDDEQRQTLAKCLQRLDVPIRDGARGDRRYLYIARADDVASLLTAVGAHQAVLRVEELRLRKQLVGKLTREMNCDGHNLDKQTDAGLRQVEAIERLRASGRLDALPPALREAALARLARPDASLEELGRSLDPPVGKSGMNHRLRRVARCAAEYEEQDRRADAPPQGGTPDA